MFHFASKQSVKTMCKTARARASLAFLLWAFTLLGVAHAGEREEQLEQTYVINRMAEYILSAYLRGECGNYAPKELHSTLDGIRMYLSDLERKLDPAYRVRIIDTMNDEEIQAEMRRQTANNLDDPLAHNKLQGIEPVFSCGMVWMAIKPALMDAQDQRKRLIDILEK